MSETEYIKSLEEQIQWLRNMLEKFTPDYSQILQQTELEPEKDSGMLGGELD